MTKRVVLLLLAVVISAVLVVDVRHRSRVLFVNLQALNAGRDALNVEWGKLLLEEGAWSQHQRVEAVARTRLNMDIPRPDQVVVVHASKEQTP
ncbi:MAG: hypothetical protein BMS9Abin22_653 [Gammaproteobacteria bacterium]|nr:MAG: hypothetical protein BMS9Abin22_653 [Gammaproteobacteria bacterium]